VSLLSTANTAFRGGCLRDGRLGSFVTMGMPALIYRWYFRAHGVRGLERSVLKFAGIAPVRETLLGMVDAASDAKRQGWLDRMRDYGRRLI
jgi:putative NADPH-quinone reductase